MRQEANAADGTESFVQSLISVSLQGPTSYDSLENDIIESNSLHSFKTKLRKTIYVNY